MKDYSNLNDYELIYLVSENDEYANNIIFEKYKPLISNIAFKYYRAYRDLGLELDDLIQEGYFGLYSALKNYNDNIECVFYTYARISITSKISNLITRYKSLKYKTLNNCISLNSYIADDSETELLDIIKDNKALMPEEEYSKNELYRKISNYLYKIPMNQACILELKINGFKNISISRLLDISTNEVRNTLRTIRKNIYSLKNIF